MIYVWEKYSKVAMCDLKDLACQYSHYSILSSEEIESAIELIVDFLCSPSIKEKLVRLCPRHKQHNKERFT